MSELKAKLDEMQGEETQMQKTHKSQGGPCSSAKLNEMPPQLQELVSDLLSAIPVADSTSNTNRSGSFSWQIQPGTSLAPNIKLFVGAVPSGNSLEP
eukprot:gene28143-31244_t